MDQPQPMRLDELFRWCDVSRHASVAARMRAALLVAEARRLRRHHEIGRRVANAGRLRPPRVGPP